MPHKAFVPNPWKRYKLRKKLRKQRKQREDEQFLKELKARRERKLREERLEREAERVAGKKVAREADNVLLAVDTMSLVSTCLLLRGGMAHVSLGISMLSLKLLGMVRQGGHLCTGFKAMISLFFSGAAFCFDSRSMELSGSTILLFTQIMALKVGELDGNFAMVGKVAD